MRGRAELLLADRASVWNARPENRQLPSFPQWAGIHLLTQKKDWTDPQRRMMRQATRYHALRGMVLAALLLGVTLVGLGIRSRVAEQKKAEHAAGLVQRLLDADSAQVPGIVAELEEYRAWADPLLRDANDEAANGSRQKLHTSLALLPVDAGQLDFLYARLLESDPREVPILRDALFPYKDELLDKLWNTAEQPAGGQEPQRLRAACALARYDADSPRWANVRNQLATDLVRVPAVFLGAWMDCLRPVRTQLLAPLAVVFRDVHRRETERSLASDILADYAADQSQLLADLLMDADEKPFAVLYPKLKDRGEAGLTPLLAELERRLPPDAKEDVKEKLAKRQANAAVALLKSNQPEPVWPLLKHCTDPRLRSYLIHRLSPLGASAQTLIRRFAEEPDVSICRALLLSLGEFDGKELAPRERESLLAKLRELYRNDLDPGLRGAAEWLLRRWQQDRWLRQVDQECAKDQRQRQQRLERIRQEVARGPGVAKPQWYVNGQGQTLVVIPGPAQFLMGSPSTEAGRQEREQQHRRRVGRTFAITAKPVTVEEFLRFRKDYDYWPQYAPTVDCPVQGTSWYQAAEYCNWLSQQEGLPATEWCYEPNKDGKYEDGMRLAPDYLKRTGYRLPTEAEWEYACRAGTMTSRYYGESEELLGKYAWYLGNSGNRSWPVASLKPNDWGLFDMHGNVWNWCQEKHKDYAMGPDGKAVEDQEDQLTVNDTDTRSLRGGAFGLLASYARCAERYFYVPTERYNVVGFRVARTFR
jgi:formylglycine-generating enzyme required for sulfatase activity